MIRVRLSRASRRGVGVGEHHDSDLARPLHRSNCHLRAILALATMALVGGSGVADAETLKDALSSAYTSNPTLRAERSGLRATDEGVAQALSGWRPTVSTSADYGKTRVVTRPKPAFGVDKRNVRGYSVTVTQPVFRGLKTVNSTRQADATVFAGRQNLLNVEQTTLLDAVTAYMDVVRDQAVVNLRLKNVSVLSEQLRASNARFRVGEITKTDVAQAEARRSGALSNLAQARATLASSRATYRQIIGHQPGSLRHPRNYTRGLPKSLKQAVATARSRNPVLLAAGYTEEASRHAIEVARGDLLPEASLEASYSRRLDPAAATARTETTTVLGRLTIPLYQAGTVYSQVREAKEINNQRRLQIAEADRQVVAAAVSSWEQLRAIRELIRSARSQVEANRLAFKGVKQEALVGSRTTLDVLDAEQELLDSQVSLVSARRDEVVAAFQLLSAVGRLTARELKLPVQYYDPVPHYEETRGKWIGVGTGESD